MRPSGDYKLLKKEPFTFDTRVRVRIQKHTHTHTLTHYKRSGFKIFPESLFFLRNTKQYNYLSYIPFKIFICATLHLCERL
jgi:hypothetical protein